MANLNKHWRKSKQEEEKLRNRREIGALVQKPNVPAITGKAQR